MKLLWARNLEDFFSFLIKFFFVLLSCTNKLLTQTRDGSRFAVNSMNKHYRFDPMMYYFIFGSKMYLKQRRSVVIVVRRWLQGDQINFDDLRCFFRAFNHRASPPFQKISSYLISWQSFIDRLHKKKFIVFHFNFRQTHQDKRKKISEMNQIQWWKYFWKDIFKTYDNYTIFVWASPLEMRNQLEM